MEIIEACFKWPNDILFVKKLRLELWKCIIVMFQLNHYFTNLAIQIVFLFAICLVWEPLRFAFKSVEIFRASQYD